MYMILDFKIRSLWFVIKYWWYNTLMCVNNWFLNVLVKSNFATPTPFGRVSCFVVGICLSNYNLNSFLIHQASYSKGYQWYLMHNEVLGSTWKIGRYPIKVSEVLISKTLVLKLAVCQLDIHNFKFKWSFVFGRQNINQRTYYNLPNSVFWCWLSMESQPQNPEFRNNPENFHPCIQNG